MAHTPDDASMDSNHQFRKKSMAPAYGRNNYFPSCDFMLLYPFVAHAGQTEEEDTKQFCVKQRDENSPVVRWKLDSILSTIPSVQPISCSQP